MDEKVGGAERRWGSVWGTRGDVGFWVMSLLFGPFVLGFAVLAGWAIVGVVLAAPLALLLSDPRLDDTLWDLNEAGGLVLLWTTGLVGVIGGVLGVLLRWAPRAMSRVTLEEDALLHRGLLGSRRFPWAGMRRAFVVGSEDRDEVESWALHLWSDKGEVVLPLSLVAPVGDLAARCAVFGAFLSAVEERLRAVGKGLERGVPLTALTDAGSPLRFAMFWPHRRWMVRQQRALQDGSRVVDHRAALPSMRAAWMLRPAWVMGGLASLGALAWVRWGTQDERALWALTAGGAFLGGLLPLWNWLKEAPGRLGRRDVLTPEALIGLDAVEGELPRYLVPARGCVVDLEEGRISRPDGLALGWGEIHAVEYGLNREAAHATLDAGAPVPAWRVALERKGTPPTTHEIFHNASVDMVRHGDLDAGYGLFNWILVREVAKRAQAGLTLATGRVAAKDVGAPLREWLGRSVVRYQAQGLGGEPGWDLRVVQGEDSFEVQGALARQPEGCAAPPLWKALGAVLALALVPTGFVPGGLLAGWWGALAVHEWIMARHFASPGFRMDAEGVWVRGHKLGWDELEQTTLMPVAPGPILFAGGRRLLVAGHLGTSYAERAWLGCAAYRWVQERVCERV